MPNIKSAIKRVSLAEKSRKRNVAIKSSIKTATKKFMEAVNNNDQEKAVVALRKATSLIDKAATKGVIHKNAAARKKSSLARALNSING
ncbi:MAG TPA: 30S ribosomal protein S20 [Clostridia bacterium]|jgi:small subunit ribosomal protein S20|nr:30S ribosomal protein S20 [Clostridia bacterium]